MSPVSQVMLSFAGQDEDQPRPAAAARSATLRQAPARAAQGGPASGQAGSQVAAGVSSEPPEGGLCYDVFICHAGPARDTFVAGLRDLPQMCGQRACADKWDILKVGDRARAIREAALRTASFKEPAFTQQTMHSKHCLGQLDVRLLIPCINASIARAAADGC